MSLSPVLIHFIEPDGKLYQRLLSILLLAFSLIASMANVLTKGSVLTDNVFMQRVRAWTQCIAIDASIAGTIIRTFRSHKEGERVKTWLYALLSALLLFTAAIVSNIESVQQTLNLTLAAAYVHVFIPVEALICEIHPLLWGIVPRSQ